MFTHSKAFGQSLRELLVIPREPAIEPKLARKQLSILFDFKPRGS
jgi:hypothetical protein